MALSQLGNLTPSDSVGQGHVVVANLNRQVDQCRRGRRCYVVEPEKFAPTEEDFAQDADGNIHGETTIDVYCRNAANQLIRYSLVWTALRSYRVESVPGHIAKMVRSGKLEEIEPLLQPFNAAVIRRTDVVTSSDDLQGQTPFS